MGKYETLFVAGVAIGGLLLYLLFGGERWGGVGADAVLEHGARAGAPQTNLDDAALAATRVSEFTQRARSDFDAALAELAALPSGANRAAAALEVFAVKADEDGAIARVAAALPAQARFGFTVDALTFLAARDAGAAVQAAATSLTTQQQAVALPRIAAAAAAADPVAALAQAALVPEPGARQAYANAVLAAWAETDAAAVLAHLEGAAGAAVPNDAGLFAALAASNPERLLAVIEGFPPDARLAAQRAALGALATRDPVGTFARLESLPPGNDRERLTQTVAEAYAREDADAALRWAASLTPPSQAALNGVVGGIAAVDVERAIDFVLREVASPTMSGLDAGRALPMAELYRLMNTGRADVAGIAERLLASGNPTLRTRASAMAARWVSDDAPTAVDWVVAHAGALDAAALESIAMSAGAVDATLAARAAERLPAELRAAWLGRAAGGIAMTDPSAAEQFLSQYPGQPGYAEGIQALVERALEANSPDIAAAAARLLANSAGSANLPGVVVPVARVWAQRDGADAASWARQQGNPPAVRAAVSSWAQRDAAAARAWLLTLGSSAERDSAITGYLVGSASARDVAPLIAAYSSDAERQRSVASAVQTLARSDSERARQLFEKYLTDPALRGELEPLLRSGVSTPTQAPVFPRIVFD